MKAFNIVALSVLLAITYGMIHDQFTVRICLEYFTIGHPPVFNTTDPTLLALGWGALSTWWVGLLLGIPLALCARAGQLPQRTVASLLPPMVMVLAAMAICATMAGLIGNYAGSQGWVSLRSDIAATIPKEKQVAFLTDLWIHTASYLSGFAAGLVLCINVYRSRKIWAAIEAEKTNKMN